MKKVELLFLGYNYKYNIPFYVAIIKYDGNYYYKDWHGNEVDELSENTGKRWREIGNDESLEILITLMEVYEKDGYIFFYST